MFTTLSTFWCEFCMLSLFLEYDFQLLNSATWPFYLFPQFRSHCLPPPVRQIHPMNFRFTNSIMTNWTHIFFRHLLGFFLEWKLHFYFGWWHQMTQTHSWFWCWTIKFYLTTSDGEVVWIRDHTQAHTQPAAHISISFWVKFEYSTHEIVFVCACARTTKN